MNRVGFELHHMDCNFCHLHKAPGITPAIVGDAADHVWSVADIVSMIVAVEPVRAKRGRDEKRASKQECARLTSDGAFSDWPSRSASYIF